MASYVSQPDHNSSNSFPSGDFSFLHEVEDGPLPNGDVSSVNFDFTNMQSTLNEITHDPNAEVSLQLSKLISDNLSLKEALDKNNAMMKEQLSTIPAWRDIMKLKVEQQQKSLSEAEEKVSSLEKENASLLKKLDTLLEEMNKSKDVKDFCTKCETLESTLNNLFDEDATYESFFNEELNNFHVNMEQNLINICQDLDVLLKSKKNEKGKKLLKTFIRLLRFKIASLNGTFCATVQTDEETGYEIVETNKEDYSKEGSSNNSDHFKKYEELKEILKKKDEELDFLKKEKEHLIEKVKVYDLKIQELEMASKAQFELLSSKLDHESSIADKYRERCEILQQQIDEYQDKLDKAKRSDDHNNHELRLEIQNLQAILKMEQESNQKDKEELAKVTNRCEILQVDHDRVSKLFESLHRDSKEKAEKFQELKKAIESKSCEQIDLLTAKLLQAEEKFSEQEDIIKELQEKLSVVNEKSELIPALEAQIEVYKRDFMATAGAKDAALSEVEKLADELKTLKGKSDTGSRKSSPSSSRRNGSFSSMQPATEAENRYECCVCLQSFTSERAAVNHINRCLDESQ